MHVLRDAASLRGAVTALPEVAPFIERRIQELEEYDDYDLGELVNVCVAQAGDTLAQVEQALGFTLDSRRADAIDSHPGWYELTYVLGDDGFGVVLYVPKNPAIDGQLLEACRRTE